MFLMALWMSRQAAARSSVPPVLTLARIFQTTGRPPRLRRGETCGQGVLAFTDPSDSWLYRLYLAIDANFRLKRKKVSSHAVDPSFNKGCAYFVEHAAYKAHLDKWDKDAKDDRTDNCNTHDAVKLANIKGAAGLAATGIATVDCSRHKMKRPCSIGDLQKGERYADFYVSSLLYSHAEHTDKSMLTISSTGASGIMPPPTSLYPTTSVAATAFEPPYVGRSTATTHSLTV